MIRILIYIGITFIVVGLSGILLGLLNVINFDDFSYGLSSGIRMIGSLAILGCLMSAIGYGWLEYFNSKL